MKRIAVLNSLKISENDTVLEIGPGGAPFYRSDIYLERDLDTNYERASNFDISKPCVLQDAHNLPFEDKSIDFIFCAQVLEHSDDPGKMLSEMMRVGKSGYIETPNFYREMLFGWEFHKWIVEQEGDNKIVLYENKLPQYFGEVFHRMQVEEYAGSLMFNLNFDKFNTVFEWNSSFEYEIKSSEELLEKYANKSDKFHIRHDTQLAPMNCKGMIQYKSLLVAYVPFIKNNLTKLTTLKRFWSGRLQGRLDTTDVIEKMQCAVCGGKYSKHSGKEQYDCGGCDNYLTIKDKLLIIDNAYITQTTNYNITT